ncbi:tripartite motif-containing protein 16-like protein [Esox lucius]|uniref:Tripartite motif-containing protein 16-like n=1 Tax=Esox lucius TaxID=8010 RepID=A0AAY5KS09_ESOLU|nr:tripartite motif-containing protein 16-like protein [Esox lucius]
MAQQGVLLDQDQFCCSVCLELLKEPVTIHCGHSYCLSCIEGCWDQDDLKGVYSCPQCRQTFTPRPTLRKNNMLAEVVEKLKTGLQTASPVLCCAGPGDVSQLGIRQQKVQQRVQEREKEMKEVQQAVESLKRSAQTAVEDSEKIFTELIHSIERRRSELKDLIRAQEKAQVSQAEGLLEKLKQEIAELKKTSTVLEQISHTEDHIHFLQNYHTLSSTSVSLELSSITVHPLQYFGDVSKTVSDLREKLEDVLKGEWTQISTTVNKVHVLLPPEPKTREQFLQYSCQLTLDLNTAHKNHTLSKWNRKVISTQHVHPYPDHPDRFINYCQVLCREGLSGRCYWEVEWRGHCVHITVSYKDISRTDDRFGYNKKSLQCHDGGYYFRHNNVKTKVSGPQSSRIGVYLDYKAGTLSFYSVSDTMTLLHRVQTTFTQPLYPGFRLCHYKDTAELCKL